MKKELIVKLIAGLAYPGNPINSPEWKDAFNIYNEDMKLFDKSLILSMGCRPCYSKVAAYLVTKYLIDA